jgi:uncharacterized membrane protein (UPF0127 family)
MDAARPRRRPFVATVAVLLALALVATGCGGDDDQDDRTAGESAARQQGGGAPGATVGVTDVAAASGNAPAALGSVAPEPPGSPERTPFGGFGEAALSITAADGKVVGLCVLLALVEAQRQRGLMEVTDMAGYDGMLFAFPDDTETGFWMSNTPLPLSIGWFDAEGGLVSTADMAPCPEDGDCPSYPPAAPYRFALEVPQGDLAGFGVGPGSRMAVGGPCAG